MSTLRDTIAKLEQARAEAIATVDIALLEAMTDLAFIHVDAAGMKRGRAEFLATLADGASRFTRYQLTETEILELGDVVVVSGHFSNVVDAPNRRSEHRAGRYVRVWAKRGNAWKTVVHQSTRVD